MTTVLQGCLAIFGTGAAAVAVALLLQRSVPARTRYDFGRYGTVTSVLVASVFMLAVITSALFVWTAFNQAGRAVRQEANAVTELYWFSRTIGGAQALPLRTDVRDYVTNVVRLEWPAMAETNQMSPRSWQLANQLRYDVERLSPREGGETARYQDALRAVDGLFAARRARASAAATRIPTLMWAAVVSTGLLVVLLPMLLGDPRPAVRIVLSFVGATTVAFVVFLLYEVNVPFAGSVKVTPVPLEDALRSFADIDALWGDRP
ncbi:hypothetical protein Arub01_02150 [Actinomadura rubrobrunea]|uniref:DUF4239 domain-containing protein n=1 Tax=Actinomadura rubrobrunea TaxID=115335 RepID=A0A9W6PS21_9ACTN|nr:DUF4239 domain-containing protein [Actinomadura rubrobrunea]GLW61971.1 hypothetical protein Arub01_02150 [Actinomadura rubrobrunea]